MAAKEQQVVEVPGTVEEAVAVAYDALVSHPKVKGPPTMLGPTVIRATTGMNLKTWGDIITVEVREGPFGTRVQITSELKFGVIDWGRNTKNIEDVIGGLGPSRPGF